ncbi:metal transporter CNNM3 isoform X5 [Rhinoraja longicauda]
MAPGARSLWVLIVLCGLALGRAASRGAQVRGTRLESGAGHVYMDAGVIKASPRARFDLRVFGSELERAVWPWLGFSRGLSCDNRSLESGWLRLVAEDKQRANSSVLVRVHAGQASAAGVYYLCALGSGGLWTSLGDWQTRLEIQPQPAAGILAVWGQILLLAVLLLSSALFNLLHLSVLWLDPLELHIIRHCGSEREKRSAKSLEPIRKRGNLVLSSLVLGSVLANSALGVLFYLAFDAILPAIFVCAALMFLICEILPYTICSRYGFAIASRTSWLTCLFIIITFPISLPVALVLDLALRQDISTCYIREKILDMLRSSDPYREFVKEEFSRGALRTKVVEDIMTNLKDCFMLSAGAILDFNTMSEIMQCGHTRIPVYEDEKSNIVDIVYVKDLAMVDPEDCTPLNTITKFYNHPLHFVFNDTKLDAVLEEFKKGKSHMAMVQKVNNEGDGDPFYEVMGLVTLGDVIEEIIKSEILDESDDAEIKVKKNPAPVSFPIERKKEDFSFFKAVFTEVELFNPSKVSESALLHLLKHSSVNQEVKFDENDKLSPGHYLYQRNQPVDYFILVLQGRVEVEIGKEGLKFENGAFTYYGVSALTVPSSVHQSPSTNNKWSQRDPFSRDLLESGENASLSMYCPDYTVRALNDLQVLKVTRLQYLNALMASKIQNSSPSPETFELKVMPTSQAKLLNKQNSSTCTSRSKSQTSEEDSPERNAGV